jgi:hypothetical protein
MKLSKTYRTALIAIAGFLLTIAFHKDLSHTRTPLKGLETLSLFTVPGPMDQVGPK